MLRRPATSLRIVVVGFILASLGAQSVPARAVVDVGGHAPALAASAPMAETLVLPSGRGDGQLAIEQRGRAPVPLVSFRTVSAPRSRLSSCTLRSLAPRARSHPIRRVSRSAEDPPPH